MECKNWSVNGIYILSVLSIKILSLILMIQQKVFYLIEKNDAYSVLPVPYLILFLTLHFPFLIFLPPPPLHTYNIYKQKRR